MSFLTVLINIFSLLYIIRIVINELKKRDSIIIYYCFISSFFVLIPLTYDSLSFFLLGSDRSIENLMLYNGFHMNMDYKFLTIDIIFSATIYVFIYNVLLITSYKLIVKKIVSKYIIFKKDSLFPYIFYLILAITTILLFYYHYGLDMGRAGISYRNVLLNRGNKLSKFILYFCMISLSSVIIKGFIDKKYLLLPFFLLPIILIAFFTLSRALFISIPLLILYFIIVSNHEKIFNIFIKILIIGIAFIFILIGIRSDIGLYPLSRDVSMYDLYYGIANRDLMKIKSGFYFLNMLKTGTVFPRSNNFVSLETMLWNYRMGFNLNATLHPTLFGWTFIDLGWIGLFTSIFFGIFIGITDNLRKILPSKLGFILLSFQMAFVAVLIRGSVQYAYANIIYVIMFLIIYAIIWLLRKYLFNFKTE